MAEQLNISGPHLQVAVFCEKVLIERDGAFSLIRVIDRFNISGHLPEMPPNNINFTIFVSFKAGFCRGKMSLKIVPTTPNGKELPGLSFTVLFEGDDERGVNVQGNMTMIVQEEGRYWFDVLLGDTLVTRMPLMVVYQQTQFVGQPGQQ